MQEEGFRFVNQVKQGMRAKCVKQVKCVKGVNCVRQVKCVKYVKSH